MAYAIRRIDITGQEFGRLTVVRFHHAAPNGAHWLCSCICGKEAIVTASLLRTGNTKSCGCLKREMVSRKNFRHGLTYHNSPALDAYRNARRRCTNPKDEAYPDYGGRGIECRFKHAREFILELGPHPGPGYTVDRINNEGHYEPGNIRWADWKTQAANKRPRKRKAA